MSDLRSVKEKLQGRKISRGVPLKIGRAQAGVTGWGRAAGHYQAGGRLRAGGCGCVRIEAPRPDGGLLIRLSLRLCREVRDHGFCARRTLAEGQRTADSRQRSRHAGRSLRALPGILLRHFQHSKRRIHPDGSRHPDLPPNRPSDQIDRIRQQQINSLITLRNSRQRSRQRSNVGQRSVNGQAFDRR
jgi:hypothetical protein